MILILTMLFNLLVTPIPTIPDPSLSVQIIDDTPEPFVSIGIIDDDPEPF